MSEATLAQVVELAGWTLLHFLWQGTAVAACLWCVLIALRKAGSQIRYAAACAALLAMSLLPAVTLAWLPQTALLRSAVVTASERSNEATVTLVDTIPNVSIRAESVPAEGGRSETEKFFAHTIPNRDSLQSNHPSTVSLRIVSDRLVLWLPTFVALWGAGVLVQLARLGLGWSIVRRLKAQGSVLPDELIRRRFDTLHYRLGIRRDVRILATMAASVPMVIGCWKPVILVPTGLIIGLVPAQLDAILAHELMHVRRHDFLVNLLQNVVEALLFYHPAVWWVSAQIRAEREHCCDDGAAALCGSPVDYASALFALAELRQPRAALGMAATGGSLLARIQRLAGAAPPERISGGWTGATIALLLAAGIALGMRGAAGVDSPNKPDANSPAVADQASPDTTNTQGAAERASISGRLLDERGEPIAKALLWLAVYETWEHGPDGPPVIATAESAADGRFELTPARSVVEQFVKAQSTEFQVWVRKPGLALTRHVSRERLPDEPIEIRLAAEPSTEFQIRNPDGSPARDVTVTISSASFLPRSGYHVIPKPIREAMHQTTNHEGRVSVIGLPREQLVSLNFEKPGLGRQYYGFHARGRKIPTEHILRNVGAIRGRVVLPSGASADLTALQVRIATLESTEHGQDEMRAADAIVQPASDGSFHIPAIATGTIRVWVTEPDGFGFRADPPIEGLKVQPGGTATLEIPLRKAVSVTRQFRQVGTNAPIPGIRVHMQYKQQEITARTGADGRYTAWILPDVDYHTVFNTPDVYIHRYIHEHNRTRAPANSVNLELSPIELIKGRTIEGTVVGADGHPLSGVSVGADWTDRTETGGWSQVGAAVHARESMTTDAKGHFTLSAIHPNLEITLTPSRSGIVLGPAIRVGTSNTDPVRIQTTHFDFTVLRGRLVDVAGKPIAGAELKLEYEQGGNTYHAMTWIISDADGQFQTPPHFPRHLSYRIMTTVRGRDVEPSPWMVPAVSGDRFPDFRIDRARLTLQDVPEKAAKRELSPP